MVVSGPTPILWDFRVRVPSALVDQTLVRSVLWDFWSLIYELLLDIWKQLCAIFDVLQKWIFRSSRHRFRWKPIWINVGFVIQIKLALVSARASEFLRELFKSYYERFQKREYAVIELAEESDVGVRFCSSKYLQISCYRL